MDHIFLYLFTKLSTELTKIGHIFKKEVCMLANSGYFKIMILFGDIPKGDLISKCLFGVFDSTKK